MTSTRWLGAGWSTLVTLALAVAIAVQFKAGDGGYQLVSDHVWAKALGIHWSLGIDGISLFLVVMTAVLFPLALLGARAERDPGPSWPGCCCSRRPAWAASSPSTCPVLPVLRADPGAGVLHHRRLGLRPPGLRGHQVLHLHLRRLGLPAGGHPGRGLHPPVPDRGAHLRAPGPHAHPPVGDRRGAAVPGLHRRLRRQGPDLPVPHLVARRLRRGADGRGR